MGTYMVVAHRTLVGPHLLDHVRERARNEPDSRFHLVVPVRHPRGAWTDGEIQAAARTRLDEGIASFEEAGLTVTGEVGDASPVYAVSTALRTLDFDCDGIILSTLPVGVSAWLHMDVEHRLKREFDVPVTHLVAARSEKATSSA